MTEFDVSFGVRVAAALRPDKIAIVDRDRKVTFASLAGHINRVANGILSGLNLSPGERVALLAPNCLEFIELTLGLAAARTPAVFLNVRLSSRELSRLCEDCDVRTIFVHPNYRGLVEGLDDPGRYRIVDLGPDYDEWLNRASDALAPAPGAWEDIFCVAPTGGTSGRSKGVMLSHRSRIMMYHAMAGVFGCYGWEDKSLTISPLFHGAGFNFCFATLYFGGTVVLLNKFDPEETLRMLIQERITNASVVPTHLSALFGLGESRLRAADLSSLKMLVCNGAPLSPSMKAFGSELWSARVLHEAYGGTEAGIISTMAPHELLQRPDSVGELFPGTLIELRDEDGGPVDVGGTGELHTRSPYLFSGYVGSDRSGLPGNGWFSAGDMGRIDKDGFLYLLDRKDEKIISGGVNIYPSEVELALADHPAVAEVAVFGIADPYWGERVHAIVSLEPGRTATGDEILAFSEARLGGLKKPRSIEIRNELPRSAAGKILRRVLRDEHRALLAARPSNPAAEPGSGHGS